MTVANEDFIPVWDIPLTALELKKLAPAQRGARTLTSLTRKVELLEAWAREGKPDGSELPSDRTKLRRWTDTKLRLWAWADPLVDAPDGRNTVLIRRFIASIRSLQQRRRDNLRIEIDLRDAHIGALEMQNLALLSQIRVLQAKIGVVPIKRK
jgi:hypothetical protein